MARLLPFLLFAPLVIAPDALAQQATEEDFDSWPGMTRPDAGSPGAKRAPSSPPEEGEWVPFPGESAADDEEAPAPEYGPPLPPPPIGPPPPPPPPSVSRSGNDAAQVPGPPLEPNTVSFYGGRPFGQWSAAAAFSIGFPLVTARVGLGLTDRIDVGLGFDTFYGIMNEPRAFLRVLIAGGERVHFAAKVEGGAATFIQPPNNEGNGARWLTGRRNYNLAPALVLSIEGESPRSARFFFELSYLIAFDTQPFQEDPLGGIPGPLQISGNIPVRGGVEVPFSASTSFLVQLGFELHGRREDSSFMPTIAVGLVTGF